MLPLRDWPQTVTDWFQECRVSVPKPVITTPQTIESILGSLTDIRDIVERFFENIHLWLPTISRKRLQLTLESPSFELTSDLSLLLLSMKLIAQSGHRTAQDAQSPLYWLVKTYAATVESSGMTTVSMMQSLLLITAYELGHGILPAAYLSSGHCVRFGTLMGIHDRQKAPQILRRPGSFAEIEELRRLWWAAILLDRYSNMGLEQARPGTYDPPPNVVLPADEAAWDQGEMTTSEPLYVSTATSVQAGGFARTCQVAHLMGRTLNTMNDTFTDSSLRFTQALQLHRTLTALSNILSAEAQQNPSRYLTACAMSLGTLMRLYEPFCCTESNQGNHTYEETEMQAASISGMKDVSARVLGLSSLIQTEMDRSLASISPLVADGLYTAAAGFQWIAHETGLDEPLAGYKALRAVLTRLSSRWAVAGEYIKILEASLHLFLATIQLTSISGHEGEYLSERSDSMNGAEGIAWLDPG